MDRKPIVQRPKDDVWYRHNLASDFLDLVYFFDSIAQSAAPREDFREHLPRSENGESDIIIPRSPDDGPYTSSTSTFGGVTLFSCISWEHGNAIDQFGGLYEGCRTFWVGLFRCSTSSWPISSFCTSWSRSPSSVRFGIAASQFSNSTRKDALTDVSEPFLANFLSLYLSLIHI